MSTSLGGERRTVAALTAIVLAATGFAIWQRVLGAEPDASVRLRDDAYYYFAFADHVASGAGPCVSAGVPTSGVHWLWAWLLAGGCWLLPGIPVVGLATTLGLVLHAATAGLLARGGGALLGLLYLGNPFLLHEAMNGQETALACLGCLVLLLAAPGGGTGFVIASMATVFARSDLAIFVVALALWRHGLHPRAALAPVCSIGLVLGTDLLVTGRWFQDAGAPLPWLFWQDFLAGDPGGSEWLHKLWWQLRPCLFGFPFMTVSTLTGAVLIAVAWPARWSGRWRFAPLAIVGLGTLLGARDWEPALLGALLIALLPPSRLGWAPAILLAAVALAAVHYGLRLHAPAYYFAPFGVAAWLGLRAIRATRTPLADLLVVALALTQAFAARQPPAGHPWQQEMWLAGREARTLLGPAASEPLGCFNSGIVTCAAGASVMNLDGRVNRAAFEALRARRLDAWLDTQGVRFLLDYPAMFAPRDGNPHASGRYFAPGFHAATDLVEIARFDRADVTGGWPGTDSFRLYWRRGRGSPPLPLAAPRLVSLQADAAWIAWPGDGGEGLSWRLLGEPGPGTRLPRVPGGVAGFFRIPRPPRRQVEVLAAGHALPLFTF